MRVSISTGLNHFSFDYQYNRVLSRYLSFPQLTIQYLELRCYIFSGFVVVEAVQEILWQDETHNAVVRQQPHGLYDKQNK
jgi:hypothetical protein